MNTNEKNLVWGIILFISGAILMATASNKISKEVDEKAKEEKA